MHRAHHKDGKQHLGHAGEHKHHSKMIDNRMVKDTHQEGIKRVIQKEHDARDGHFGKMGLKHHEGKGFKRENTGASPVRG
jgi:hypothetical protein